MRKPLVALLLLFSGHLLFGQSTANSPYSSFGLGELGGLDHSVFGAMGNNNISVQDSLVANFYNPSSYSTLAKGQPIFSLGFSARFSTFSEAGNSSFEPLASIQHFVMAVPFANRFGLAFGLKPYSRRGYEFSKRIDTGGDSLFYNYKGSGSLNEVFFGFSADIIKLPNTRLAIGGNAGYLFGTVRNERKSGLIETGVTGNNYAGGIGIVGFRSQSFHYELGLSLEQRLNEHHLIGVYATADPLQKLKGTYSDELYYSDDINDPRIYDTLHFYDTLRGNVTNIPTYSFALKYQFNFKMNKGEPREYSSELSVHLGYSLSDWSKFENTFDPSFSNNFLSTNKYSLGLQFIPETDFIANDSKAKYYFRMRYRLGAYYQTLPYTTNGEQVRDFGTTFGFGFPVAISRTLSSVNLGFSIGNRGVSDPDALKEKYYGVNIGLIIAPNSADKWFKKRKLN